MNFLHSNGAMNRARANSNYAACPRKCGDSQGIEQILWTVWAKRCRRAHCARQDYGFDWLKHRVQKVCCLLKRIRAMGNDNRVDIFPLQKVINTFNQGYPNGKTHVFAVHLRDLLGDDLPTKSCTANGAKHLSDTQLRRGVSNVISCDLRRTSNGSAGTQNHDFFVSHGKI